MNDLETLRPEVMEAAAKLDDFDSAFGTCGHWQIIRAELLRLARENAELRRAWDDALLTGTGILKVERVDPATVMLPVAPRQVKGTPVPQSEHETLTERAEKAEAELAALKARIFHGIVLDVDDLARGHAGLPSEWRGKRVRLVVEK